MQTQTKSISPWLDTEFAAHQWCSSVFNINPSGKIQVNSTFEMAAVHLSSTTFWNIECVLSSPGMQIFVLLSLSSVHQWSRFLTRLSEAQKVRQRSDTLAFRLHIDLQNVCFFPLTVIIGGWSTLWWLVSSRARTPSAETDCVCDVFPLADLWLLTSFQEFTPLASSQWRLSYLSIARSVLRCHGNILWLCKSADKWPPDTSLCSSLLSGSAEVCGPTAKGRVDVQGEC